LRLNDLRHLLLACALLVALASCKPALFQTTPRRKPTAPTKPTRPHVAAYVPPHPQLLRAESDRRYREHPKGWSKLHSARAKTRPEMCVVCHTPESCISCHQDKVPNSHRCTGWVKAHGAMRNRSECRTCHKQAYCNACHGMPMPHSRNWRSVHISKAKQDKTSCRQCHQQAYCDDCHRKTKPSSHIADWVAAHKGTVGDKSACLKCHDRKYCDTCHKTTKPKSHLTTWSKDHGKYVVESKPDCTTCHDDKSCKDCHGVDMPHPPKYLLGHKGDKIASRKPDSACFKCHDQKYCGMCHNGQIAPK